MRQNIWKRLTLIIVLTATLCISAITLTGCGGDGDGDSDPVGYVRFYNDLRCSNGTTFTAKFTIAGKEIYSNSGQWSGCAQFDPATYTAVGFFSACGLNMTGRFSVNIAANCTEELTITVSNGRVVARQRRACPGACPSAQAASTESTYDDNIEILKETPLEGLDPDQFMPAD